MATTLRLSIKVAPCNVSEQKADGESSVGFQKKKKKKSDARKNRGICECDFLTLPFFSHSLFSVFLYLCVCLSCSYGQFWGRWTRSVGLSGRGRRYPGAAHSQLPPTASYLVQGRAQNPTQQSHVSTLFPFVSFCALYLFLYVFDPVNPFQCFVCSWGCFSLRVPVPACRLSFITLHSVLKPSLNFSCTTRSKTKTVLALCEMNSPLFVPLLFVFSLGEKKTTFISAYLCLCLSSFWCFWGHLSMFARRQRWCWYSSGSQWGQASTGAADQPQMGLLFCFPLLFT